MLTWREHLRTSTVLLFRSENRSNAYATLGQISSVIRGLLVGNLLVGLFIGTLSTAAFGILRLPYFYILGYLSGFLSLVPYLGVLLALIPPLLVGLQSLRSGEYLVVIVVTLGLHLFALNVLHPKYLGKRLKLNPLSSILALLFWEWMWGAPGLLLAIPIVAAEGDFRSRAAAEISWAMAGGRGMNVRAGGDGVGGRELRLLRLCRAEAPTVCRAEHYRKRSTSSAAALPNQCVRKVSCRGFGDRLRSAGSRIPRGRSQSTGRRRR
jgi:hypothetical protein